MNMEYRYVVVTMNGHGIHGPEWLKFKSARTHAHYCANDRGSNFVLGPFEIERVEYIDRIGGSRRYSMRQRSRWVPWDHERDHTVRRPDHIWYEPFDPASPASREQRAPKEDG